MEEHFQKMITAGKNTLDNIIKWWKDAKIIDGIKVTEEIVRSLFADVSDPKNVSLDQFKEALGKLAAGQNKSFDEYAKMLASEAPKVLNVVKAGVSALKGAFSRK